MTEQESPTGSKANSRFTARGQIATVILVVVVVSAIGVLLFDRNLEATASFVAAITIISTIRFM